MADDTVPSQPSEQGGGILDHTFRTSNLEELEEFCQILAPHRLTALSRSMVSEARFTVNFAQDFGLLDFTYGRSVISIAPPQPGDYVVFAMATKGVAQLTVSGEEFPFTEQKGVIFPATPGLFINFVDDSAHHLLMLKRHKIEVLCAKLLGRELPKSLEFETQFSLGSNYGQSWKRLVQYAAGELSHPHSLTRHLPSAQQQLEQMLMSALLLGHNHTYSHALLRPQSAAAPYYVRRAESYIEAHFAEPLSLADIAAHAGVSARSLQNGFQSFRGLTPMAFLRRLRLAAVHRLLLIADPAVATVTEIALSCGFTHMGEFGVLYKRTYGVTPKQTLLKAVR